MFAILFLETDLVRVDTGENTLLHDYSVILFSLTLLYNYLLLPI